jgi:hypothetical protein
MSHTHRSNNNNNTGGNRDLMRLLPLTSYKQVDRDIYASNYEFHRHNVANIQSQFNIYADANRNEELIHRMRNNRRMNLDRQRRDVEIQRLNQLLVDRLTKINYTSPKPLVNPEEQRYRVNRAQNQNKLRRMEAERIQTENYLLATRLLSNEPRYSVGKLAEEWKEHKHRLKLMSKAKQISLKAQTPHVKDNNSKTGSQSAKPHPQQASHNTTDADYIDEILHKHSNNNKNNTVNNSSDNNSNTHNNNNNSSANQSAQPLPPPNPPNARSAPNTARIRRLVATDSWGLSGTCKELRNATARSRLHDWHQNRINQSTMKIDEAVLESLNAELRPITAINELGQYYLTWQNHYTENNITHTEYKEEEAEQLQHNTTHNLQNPNESAEGEEASESNYSVQARSDNRMLRNSKVETSHRSEEKESASGPENERVLASEAYSIPKLSQLIDKKEAEQ